MNLLFAFIAGGAIFITFNPYIKDTISMKHVMWLCSTCATLAMVEPENKIAVSATLLLVIGIALWWTIRSYWKFIREIRKDDHHQSITKQRISN